MTSRTKLALCVCAWAILMLVNVFSLRLGIPPVLQWITLFVMLVPLALTYRYSRQIREAQAIQRAGGEPSPEQRAAFRQQAVRRLVIIWGIGVAIGLAAPLWLPLTGATLGWKKDLVTGLITAVVVSLIFGFQLRQLRKN